VAIHVALNHVTHYRYDRRVALSPQVVRLRPAPHCRTPILAYSLRVEPTQHFENWQQDPFANYLARLVFPEKTTEFKITVDLVAEMAVYNPFDFFLEPAAEQFPFRYDAGLAHDLAPYLACDPLTPKFAAFLETIDRKPRRTIDFLVALNQRLQQDIRYLIRMEPGVQTPEQTLERAAGSCRDTGWLMVQALRHFGLASRFVSGYLIQLRPDVKSLDGPSGAEHDFTDLHAWCEVYLPGAGWVGLDPTSGLMAGEGHIPVACTPEPGSAAPVTGAVDESGVEFSHEMKVTRIYESPRVTKPYTDEQWQAIVQLGHAVDDQLQGGGRWVASPPSSARRTATAPSGTPTRWGRPSAAWRRRWCTNCESAMGAAASCTTDRASGTPASSCRAGRCPSAGAPTGSHAGATRRCSRTSGCRSAARSTMRSASCARSRGGWGWTTAP
jgi:transglutaminase-like putative cysteine protease